MKVLGTDVFLTGSTLDKLKEKGHTGSRNQFRIICKCKSMADANRKVKPITNIDKTFVTNYCAEAGNKKELELFEHEEVWVRVDQTGDNYISMSELLDEIL
ncbi:MAG: hypothetical protein LUH21_04310 [Clostridiales bacterium]|nr:hypothetical protein [Clostridiales bacterium]